MTNVTKQPQNESDNIQTNTAPSTVGGIIDRMFELREERKVIGKQDELLKAEYTELELALLNAMDTQETMQSRGRAASATITEDLYPTNINWDVVFEYVKANDAYHLLQRRLNTAPWKELLQLEGEPLPGTESYLRRTISLRKV